MYIYDNKTIKMGLYKTHHKNGKDLKSRVIKWYIINTSDNNFKNDY